MQSCKGGSQSSHSDLPSSYLLSSVWGQRMCPWGPPWSGVGSLRGPFLLETSTRLASPAPPPEPGASQGAAPQGRAPTHLAPRQRSRAPTAATPRLPDAVPRQPCLPHATSGPGARSESGEARGEREKRGPRRELSQERRGASATLQRSLIERGQPRGISKYKSAQNTIFMG